MKVEIISVKDVNEIINKNYNFSTLMDRYNSDIKFMMPWEQDESMANKQKKENIESKNVNLESKKQFMEFIEANNFY